MIVRVNKRHAELVVPERITSGSVGMTVTLEFSAEWAGLAKAAVFTDLGSNTYDVLESAWSDNVVEIPHELMQTAGNPVWLGVYGCETNDDDDVVLAIPTVYCKLGTVKQGADPSGDESTDPTLAVWAQLQQDVDNVEDALAAEALARAAADAGKQDTISDLSTIRSGAAAGATALQAVPNTYRTAADQDAIDAGKQDKLIAGSGITIAADGKTISSTGGGGGSSAWDDITGKPSTFPPSSHTHAQSDVAGLADALNGKQETITDLSNIRSGAALGATALQPDTTNGFLIRITYDTTTSSEIQAILDAGNTPYIIYSGNTYYYQDISYDNHYRFVSITPGSRSTNDPPIVRRIYKAKDNASGGWGVGTITLYSTTHKPTASDIGALPDTTVIPTVPTDDINANTAARHTHSNKAVLDGITADDVAHWNLCYDDYRAALGVI